MPNPPISPRTVAKSLCANIHLIGTLTKRDIAIRYRGSALGILWSVFNPLFMLIVYTFVFSVVFKARWGTGTASKTDFALILFAGLIVFNIFSESINRAPALIVNNTSYVKKVVFPLEILPFISTGAVLFHAIISLLVWLVAYMILVGPPRLTILLLPLVITPLLILILGLNWIVASIGVYMRDTAQLVSLFTTVLMFMSPIFYPSSLLPPGIRPFLMLNPLAPTIEQAREVLFWGTVPDILPWAVNMIVSSIIAWLGFVFFQKTRKGFADVL